MCAKPCKTFPDKKELCLYSTPSFNTSLLQTGLPALQYIPLVDSSSSHFLSPSYTKISEEVLQKPFALCVNNIQTDAHLGRIVTGRWLFSYSSHQQ
jgi:hypothetical protein